MERRALDGIRVLDLSNHGAAPMAAMHLADHGADVIKVEHPDGGDEMRRWGNLKDGVGLFYKVANRNKRAITLDLKQSRGQEIVRRLASEVDVVIENFRTGTLERWELGYAQLAKNNPALVMLHVTGFGRTGPRATSPGFGSLTEAFAGAVYANGFPDRRPLMQPFMFGDSSAAIFGAFTIMVALLHAQRTGEGQEIDLALHEPVLAMLGPMVIDHDQLGVVQERSGGESPHVAPRGTFRTRDGGWVAASGSTQATFERICRALAAEALIVDPRFVTNAARVANIHDLFAAMDRLIGGFDRSELLERAARHDATIVPVNSIADIVVDPQIAARQNIADVPDHDFGTVKMQNVAGLLSVTPGRITHAGRALGADTAEVLGALGLSDDDLATLERDGVI